MSFNFTANNTLFRGIVCNSEKDKIRSATGEYALDYSKKTLSVLLDEVYNIDDVIIVDRNVYNIDSKCFDNRHSIVLDATENNKVIQTSLSIIEHLHKTKFTKLNKLVVIGGGIIQDIGGFAAAIFKRGIPWILIPTTILSMTDSSIGSKVSLNHISKNMIGVFYPPKNVYVSSFFLKTLLPIDITSGLGEALKLSIIGGNLTFDSFMKSYENGDYLEAIRIALSVKKPLIEHDEFDMNERKVLNYGHEFGHAIECSTNYKVPHGIGVLFGIVIVNRIFSPNKFDHIENFIVRMIPDSVKGLLIDKEDLFKHLSNNKNNMGKEHCFITLNSIGNTSITYVEIETIREKIIDALSGLFVFR